MKSLLKYKKIFQLTIFLFLGLMFFQFSYASSIEQDILDLVNQERKMLGVFELEESEFLKEVANFKAQDMLNNSYFAHTSPAGVDPWHWFDKAGYEYKYAGENLAMDFRTARSVVRAWMNSPTHKENILSKNYTEIGIAVMDGVIDGAETKIAVQSFGMPIDQKEYLTVLNPKSQKKEEIKENILESEKELLIGNVSVQPLKGESFDELVVYSEVAGEERDVFVQIGSQNFKLTQMDKQKYLGLISLKEVDLKKEDILIKTINEDQDHYYKVPRDQYQELIDEGEMAENNIEKDLQTGLLLGVNNNTFKGDLNINFQNMIFLVMSIFCIIVIINVWALEREEERLLEFCQAPIIDDQSSVKG